MTDKIRIAVLGASGYTGADLVRLAITHPAVEIVARLASDPLPADTILNVNVPDVAWEDVRGFEVTRLGNRHRAEPCIRQNDPRGRTWWWIGAAGPEQDAGPGTDFHAVRTGHISITPIHVDLTRYQALENVASWVGGLSAALEGGAKVAVLGFRPADPLAYGRIIADADGTVRKMVEFKDAAPEERAVGLCNSGLIVAHSDDMWPLLESVGNDNAQGEYYLPDVATNAIARGDRVVVIETDADEVAGINSRAELALAERRWQDRRRTGAMDDGATLIAPETVWFAWDTRIGRDVLIEPSVFFGPGVTVADGAILNSVVPTMKASPVAACISSGGRVPRSISHHAAVISASVSAISSGPAQSRAAAIIAVWARPISSRSSRVSGP